jgi:hypothetical protein
MVQQRHWGVYIGHEIAKKLHHEGCFLAALTLKRTTTEFTRSQKEVPYQLIIDNDNVMSRPADYLSGETYSISEICSELGVNSIWPIVLSLRNHVRSYKEKYYYGFSPNLPEEEILLYVQAVYKYLKIIFTQFKPELIIAPNFVALPHIMLNLYAKKRGVEMIALYDSKVSGVRIFANNYNVGGGYFHELVNLLNEKKTESPSREKARKYISEFRANFKPPEYLINKPRIGLYKKTRQFLSPFRQIFYWYYKRPINVLESTGITPDFRPPKIILRDFFSHLRNKRFLDRFPFCPLEKLGRFVYFPLQVQPEATIDVIAPYFGNQIETARLAAMSLPADYALVVREHPGMAGRRSPSYIKKIARLINVKFVDYRIPNEIFLKKASLIISPSGTSIAEAAFLNKPVIQLGNLETTLMLPNVRKHTDFTTLSAKIKEILGMDFDAEYERRLENYVAAAFDSGVSLNYNTIWKYGSKEIEEIEALWECFKKEAERILLK